MTVAVPQDVTDFKQLFLSDWFDAVGISLSTDRHIQSLGLLLPQLREASDNLNLHLFVGGPMAYLAPELLQGLSAHVLAEDAPMTVAHVTQAMPASATMAT